MRINECKPLVKWSLLFEKLDCTTIQEKNYISKVLYTVSRLSDKEQMLITNKYLNLNEGDSFQARLKSDDVFAEGLDITVREFKSQLDNAIKNFNNEWRIGCND